MVDVSVVVDACVELVDELSSVVGTSDIVLVIVAVEVSVEVELLVSVLVPVVVSVEVDV